MKLHKMLAGTSMTCGLLVVGGICGAVQYGTGYFTVATMAVISVLTGVWSAYESGSLSRWKGGRE